MLIFRQLVDSRSSTYTYLLADSETREAVIIDPVYDNILRDCALIDELNLKLLYSLDTHVHADHVTAAWLLRDRLGSRIALSAAGGAEGADRLLSHGDRIEFGKRALTVRSTPGHTNGCITYVLDDESMAFTGDALLIRGCGRTDFQQGDSRKLFESVRGQILSLPDSCLLYPGHDYRGRTATTVLEEKQYNPRLGEGRSVEDFVGYMDNLGLGHPKQIDVAVPANLKCGQPAASPAAPKEPDWAPVRYSFAGVWEIEGQWLSENRNNVTIVDVRETPEFDGPLGHIDGAKLVPIGELKERAPADIPTDRPVVCVCRSGARSAQACNILSSAGYADVANLSGGMLRWRADGH
jgi:glyoxylase-like metal-dependent hydrolase (beta-lactamase superfamily II)/rhodanese-related sulfurtransferase